MTKRELLVFLEPFDDDTLCLFWDDKRGTWSPVEPCAEYSARTGKTNIWFAAKSNQEAKEKR